MATEKTGQILSLVGLFLLVLSRIGGRSRGRRGSQTSALQRWQRWIQLAGFFLVLAGLLVMWAQK